MRPVLRKAQLKAMERALQQDFRQRVHDHLLRIFPDECADLGTKAVDEMISAGIERAQAYGMTTEQQTLCFIDMMFLVDPSFDSDPQHSWAKTILLSPDASGQEKLDALYRKAEELEDELAE